MNADLKEKNSATLNWDKPMALCLLLRFNNFRCNTTNKQITTTIYYNFNTLHVFCKVQFKCRSAFEKFFLSIYHMYTKRNLRLLRTWRRLVIGKMSKAMIATFWWSDHEIHKLRSDTLLVVSLCCIWSVNTVKIASVTVTVLTHYKTQISMLMTNCIILA